MANISIVKGEPELDSAPLETMYANAGSEPEYFVFYQNHITEIIMLSNKNASYENTIQVFDMKRGYMTELLVSLTVTRVKTLTITYTV